jgi:hypothetical protein
MVGRIRAAFCVLRHILSIVRWRFLIWAYPHENRVEYVSTPVEVQLRDMTHL